VYRAEDAVQYHFTTRYESLLRSYKDIPYMCNLSFIDRGRGQVQTSSSSALAVSSSWHNDGPFGLACLSTWSTSNRLWNNILRSSQVKSCSAEGGNFPACSRLGSPAPLRPLSLSLTKWCTMDGARITMNFLLPLGSVHIKFVYTEYLIQPP